MEKFLAALLAVVILVPAAVVGINAYKYGAQDVTATYEYSETTDELGNPYCGWYDMYGYALTDASYDTFDSKTDNYLKTSADTRLIMLEINLKNFNTGSLSDNALSQLDHIISTWGSNGHNIILRFLYDWDGKAKQTEPESIDIIKTHMSQTAEIVNKYTRYVYIMQGIFVGNFAEMNNSNYMDEANMLTLANYLDSVIDKRIYLSVRTPQHLRTILKTASLPDVAATLSSGSNSFRIGLFNDGCLGSSIDVGTYGSSDMSFSEANYTSKGSRTQEIQYQNTLCLMVPNGGEAVLDNSYNDIDNAAIDLAAMHVSYLNSAHDMSVINKWKTQTYTGSGVFNGTTAFQYIGTHMGYRYVLRSSELSLKTLQKTTVVKLSLDNVGFAPTYRDFNVYVNAEVTDSEGNTEVQTFDVTSQTNARMWYPGQTTNLTLSVPVENTTDSTITLYLKVTDATTGETIKFANSLTLTGNGYELGYIDNTNK
jgi:hypothetical protein